MIKRLLASLTATTVLALAPLAAQAEPAAAYDWSGSYFTIYGGSTKSVTTATDITGQEYGDILSPSDKTHVPGGVESIDLEGAYVGVDVGYNFQRGAFVFGGALELGAMNNKGQYVHQGYGHDVDDGITSEISKYVALTSRLGYSHGRSLFFVKAGPAWAQIRNIGGEFDGYGNKGTHGDTGYDHDEAGFGDGTRMGYTLGLGVEHALNKRLSLVAEYNYADFGTQLLGDADGDMSQPFAFENEVELFKVGLSFRF